MTATQTKHRRGTSSQCEAMTPAEAEIVVDTSNNRLRLGNGVVPGGIIIPNSKDMQSNVFSFVSAGGTANAITGTLVPAIAAYAQPLSIKLKVVNTNTNAVTINLNALGTRNIYKISGGSIVPLVAGDLVAGGIYELVYDGTQFIVLGAMGGLIEVGQGQLKTSVGTFSATTGLRPLIGVSGSGVVINFTNIAITRPGGQYGFNLNSRSTSSGDPSSARDGGWLINGISTSFSSTVLAYSLGPPPSGATGIVYGEERYMLSSPPYDLGDGDVGGFIFALVNSAGEVVSHYAADTPPWAYNGPTDIRATHQCPVSKKKYQKCMKKRTYEQIMDGAPVEYQTKEITNKVKNADMKLIPHPFGDVPEGHRVVMFDPMDDKIQRTVEYQNAGGTDWAEALTNGKIEIGDECKRCGPKAVHIHKLKYKHTKKF